MAKNNIKKDFIWNLIGSSLHAFNSLFFLIIVTRINGIEVSGYFSYGFTISNIYLTIATFGGRGFQVTDIKKEFSDNLYKSFRIFTTLISLILSVLFFLLFNYPVYKYFVIILLIIARVFEAISDVYFGIMQKNNKLYTVGKSLFYKNLITLILFITIELLFKNLYLSIISWVITNILFLIFYDIKNTEKIKPEKFKFEKNYKRIINKTIFYFGFIFLSIFVINIPRYFIDIYLSDSLQGVFGILTMPATMVVLLASFILQPYALKLAKINKNNKQNFKKECIKISSYILGVSLVCLILSFFVGIPILNFIYGINLNKYKMHLLIVMLGASFFAINSFLSLIFTIKRKMKSQFVIYIISIITSLIFSYILINKYGFLGGIISYALTMAGITIFYAITINVKFRKSNNYNSSNGISNKIKNKRRNSL